MMYSVRLARLALTGLILTILVFMACQRPGANTGGENGDVQIALQPMPLEEMLVVVLTDAAGAPITDATVALEGNMNHAGMIPVLADPIADDADGSADGRYHLPFTFTMLGDWIISVTVTQADGSSFTRDLDVSAREEGIEGDNVLPMDNASAPASGSESSNEAATAATIHIDNTMARPAPLAGGTGAVYFSLHNDGDAPVKLIGADSSAAAAVELHTTINDNGVLRMRQITDGLEVGAGESVQLTPGAMHLMLVDLAAPLLKGDLIEVTLHFEDAGDLTLEVPVVNENDLPDGDEGEHTH